MRQVKRNALDRLFSGLQLIHIEHIVDVLFMKPDIQYVTLEPLSVARIALKNKVGHELHLNSNDTGPLALFASSPFGIEREIL